MSTASPEGLSSRIDFPRGQIGAVGGGIDVRLAGFSDQPSLLELRIFDPKDKSRGGYMISMKQSQMISLANHLVKALTPDAPAPAGNMM